MRVSHCLKVFVACTAVAIATFGSRAIGPIAVAAAVATPLMPGAPHGSVPITPAAPKPQSSKHPFSLSIVSITPSAPVAGQKLTIAYVARNLAAGDVVAHVSATVAGGFPQTANGKPPVDSVYPGNQEVKGTLVVTGGPVGPNAIELTLSQTPCGAAAAASAACAATIYAQASTMISLVTPPAVPTTRVRIAGTSYADIHKGDSLDGTVVSSGYVFVVHDPDCSSNFASGKNGDDSYFKKKDLPAGATLKAVDFTMYRVPPNLKTQYYAGGAGGYGSYGVKLEHDAGNALHVHWENACRGQYRTFAVVYSISFEIEIPAGMNLGEDAALATQQPYPPTSVNYTTLGVVDGATNAAAALVPEPNLITLKWNGEALSSTFAPALSGTKSEVYNNEPTPIILIADARLGAGCAPGNGNVLLGGHETTTADQFASLYGAGPVRSPKAFTACRPSSTATNDLIVTLTFLQS